MKTCKQCGSSFQIFPDDLEFYKKISVPEPMCCPECRRIQIMCFRNERIFYADQCASCGKNMVSCFSPNSFFKVFCSECWWSDKFDPLKYGRDFDFGRPFFDQFWDLMHEVPAGNLFTASLENAEYANYAASNKNCYMVTASDYNEDSFYADNSNSNRDSCNISFVAKSELIYDSVDVTNSYMCFYSQNLKNCNFCFFCADLIGCANCVGCVGLRNAQYRIFNKQYSKEAYLEELKKIGLQSHKNTQNLAEKFQKFKLGVPRKFSENINAEQCSGNYIVNSKNCADCFDMNECENCKYAVWGYKSRDIYDSYGSTGSELTYRCAGVLESYNVQFSNLVWAGSNNLYYSFLARIAKNCFGCISLHNNEYCILNKQYSKSEYEALFKKIKEHMLKTGEWGEFFPVKYSLWSYNETVANDFYPKTKEEVLKMGWRWEDKIPGTYGKETVKKENMPDNTNEARESIVDKIFACDCGRNFKIIKQEFAFYKKLGIPLPRKCPPCMYKGRLHLHNPRKLWHRSCMCVSVSHEWHAMASCPHEFDTTYSPERPEKIFCEKCYEKEIM